MDDFHQFVYAYDTEQKLEDFYREWEGAFFDRTGVCPESPEAREAITAIRSNRPFVAVGPFRVYLVDDDIGKRFAVRKIQSPVPLVELGIFRQFTHLHSLSLPEKNWRVPRFRANLSYSEDDIYEGGSFSIFREDGALARRYFDVYGTGVFDIMHIFEDDIRHTYRLNGLTWERIDDEPEIPN